MFKIGEFARLTQLSIKTLRHYDRMGLFKPAQTDRFTGYRYYSAEQLPHLNRILVLKELGFSLEQISGLLDEAVPIEQMRGMLRLRQAEQEERVRTEQARLAQIAARLAQMEGAGASTYEVVIRRVEPQLVASARATIPRYADVGRLTDEVWRYLAEVGVEAQFDAAIWHEALESGEIDAEGVVFLSHPIPESEGIRVHTLAGHESVACLVHHGSYLTLQSAYNHMAVWLQTNRYSLAGPSREVYVHGGHEQDDPSFVTDLQFPIEPTT